MQEIGGVFLPDGEEHLPEWMINRGELVDGRLTYQYHKLEAALEHVRDFRLALDVGAHCGLWTVHLLKRFERVAAFEPMAEHRECLTANVLSSVMDGDLRLALYHFGLADRDGSCDMLTTSGSSGDTRVQPGTMGGEGEIELRRFDGVPLPWDRAVGFVKIDCEGFEFPIVRGMADMIRRWAPTIIVEQKPGKGQAYGFGETDAVHYLEREHGYSTASVHSGDYIMVPRR